MQTVSQTVQLGIHLSCAEQAIGRGDWIAAKLSLGLALKVANAASNNKLKSLIMRALNHVRIAERQATKNQVITLRPNEYRVVEIA